MLNCPISLIGDVEAGPAASCEHDTQYGSWIPWYSTKDLMPILRVSLGDAEHLYNEQFRDTHELVHLTVSIKAPDPENEDPVYWRGFVAWKMFLKELHA